MPFPLSLRRILFKTPLRSKPVDLNFIDVENTINDLKAQLDASLTPPVGSEVVNARDFHALLQDRLRSGFNASANKVLQGLNVTSNSNMTVNIGSGQALVAGIGLIKTGATNTAAITAPTGGNFRYDVAVINTDNSISVEPGVQSLNPILPSISSTQRPLAVLSLYTGQTQILTADIIPCQAQGVYVLRGNDQGSVKWFWKIAEATALIGLHFTEIFVGPGNYYENILVTSKNDFALHLGTAVLKRPDQSSRAIDFTSCSRFSIDGGTLDGNAKIGAFELAKFLLCTKFRLSGILGHLNSASTAAYKNFIFETCDDYHAEGVSATSADAVGINGATTNYMVSFSGSTTILERLLVNSDVAFVARFTTDIAQERTAYFYFDPLGTFTENFFFDTLAPYFPVTGRTYRINGAFAGHTIGGGVQLTNLSRAERVSGTKIRLHGFTTDTNGAPAGTNTTVSYIEVNDTVLSTPVRTDTTILTNGIYVMGRAEITI